MKNSRAHWYFSRSRSSSSAAAAAAAASDDEAPPPFKQGRPPGPEAAHHGCMAMVHLIFAPGAGCVGRPPPSNAVVVVDTSKPAPACSPPPPALQAPRNSLDLDADQLRDIQIGVQIEPAFDALARPRPSAPPSEAETPRTPSLVARLMGIDGLPDSPAAASTDTKPREKKKRVIPESISLRQPLRTLSSNVVPGEVSRSLPDTPRASTSSVRAAPSWDVVDHPRLSLQVLKESVLDRAQQYMSMPTSPTSTSGGANRKKTSRRRDAAEGRSTREQAREIVRQAKENISNRKSNKKAAIGKENASPVQSGKENAPPSAAKPAAAAPVNVKAPLAEQHTRAPRLPLAPMPAPPQQQQQRAKPSRPPPPPPPLDPPPRAAPPPAVKCKRPDGCERFTTRIKKPSSHQVQPAAPVCSTDRDVVVSDELKITSSVSSVTPAAAAVPLEEDPEYVYLRTVLERGGFMRGRAAAGRPFKGHSVSAPVDPLVFHLLELELPVDEARLGSLRHRWNRKLLFHLTQEMLAELLLGLDPSPPQHQLPSGTALLARLWRRARSFPAADCKELRDIDSLVAADLGAASVRRLVAHPAVVEEAGDVAEEVAERVLDALLTECWVAVGVTAA